VTIIGIILSAAMITAVASLITSVQSYLIQTTIANNGDWHGAVYSTSKEQIENIKQNSEIDQISIIDEIGYSPLDKVTNETKPYLYIQGMDENFLTMLPVNVKKGSLPKNNTEIILPLHLIRVGGIEYELGDTITLKLGTRYQDGKILNQRDSLVAEENGGEELKITDEKTYTVVGFYENPSFEFYSAPGYTALTISDNVTDYATIYLKLNAAEHIYDFTSANFPDNNTSFNYDLLRLTGSSNENSYNAVLYSLGTILIIIIMLASIALIYNAFSISISERTKQFGLMKSIGATKRQLKKSVLFEAFTLSLIGVPLGIVCGLLGIDITLKLTKNIMIASFNSLFNKTDIPLTLSFSPVTILIALVVGVITVLISAYIPVKRAMKVSAIESIRQTNDIKISANKVKTSKLTYRLFGLEGMIARKYFKRNKRRYRATIISLFVSIVIFVSASSFCSYLQKGVGDVYISENYDIQYYNTSESATKSKNEIFNALSNIPEVIDSSFHITGHYIGEIASENLSKKYYSYKLGNNEEMINTDRENVEERIDLVFLSDNEYRDFLTNNQFDVERYMNVNNPLALAIDYKRTYNQTDQKYYTFDMLKDGENQVEIKELKTINGYEFSYTEYFEEGEHYYIYKPLEDTSLEVLRLTDEEAYQSKTLFIGDKTNQIPLGVSIGESIVLLYPESAFENVIGEKLEDKYGDFYFKTTNHQKAYDTMLKTLEELGYNSDYLIDIAAEIENNRSVVSMVQVFSYGFIVLISFISIANVFNTISTNINLRRREFAMLKSVGMSKRGFYKMMNYECLLYGFKAIFFGIPVAIFVTYLIYRSIQRGLNIAFYLPMSSIVISIFSVFSVVFLTMFYAMQKVKKENTIDALKNENL
ncbi:FtsX-like permease family protein, partial [Lachnoclostridium sp.]|uniref:ABC transporter permease n=1 Tax=Lachnoclostridium sp. TaxID=2028282 RepID=UPI00289BE466